MKYHVSIEADGDRVIETWGVFPIGPSKILDGIYDPEAKHLSLLLDSVTEKYMPFEVPNAKGKTEIQPRKMDTYYKFKLPEEDIPFFLANYVENDFQIEAAVKSKLILNNA